MITYLTTFGAEAAVWIVANARPEHLQAMAWLNEASGADFHLVKVEAWWTRAECGGVCPPKDAK